MTDTHNLTTEQRETLEMIKVLMREINAAQEAKTSLVSIRAALAAVTILLSETPAKTAKASPRIRSLGRSQPFEEN